MSDGWSSFVNSTPFGGFFDSGQNNKKAGQAAVGDEAGQYAGVQTPTFTPVTQQRATQQTAAPTNAGPSAYNRITTNPAYTDAQTAQMTALSNLAKNGGRSAASDANLAQIQQQENANAAGQRGAIMQQQAARGGSGNGNSLLAMLNAQQGDISDQNARDLGVAGQEANTAIGAGQAAAGIGAGLEGQQFGEKAQEAQANDAQARFNAGQDTQASEFNAGQGNQMGEFNAGQGNQISAMNNYTMPQAQFGDQMAKAGGIAGADQNAAKWNSDQQAASAKKQGGMWNGLFDMAGSTDSGQELGNFVQGLAKGGMVQPLKAPGAPKPGQGLGALDKNPVANPSNKEAMLAALGEMRKKAMGGMP